MRNFTLCLFVAEMVGYDQFQLYDVVSNKMSRLEPVNASLLRINRYQKYVLLWHNLGKTILILYAINIWDI